MKEAGKQIRLGVIGVGNMGSEHCRNIVAGRCPEITITAAADLRADRRKWAAENSPGAAVFPSGSELILQGECDAVLIATPHYSHEPLAVESMENGLHVLCEKPAAVTVNAARHMAETARETGMCLTYMFNQRTNCTYRAIRDALYSGYFGRIKRVSWLITDWYRTQRYYDSGTWRATWAGEGGGVLLNQCPHQLDLWQWILGMPKKVQSFMRYGQWHDIEVEDDVTTFMEYEDGHTGVFITSTGDPHGTNRFEVQMDGAQLICENDRLYLAELEKLEQDWTKTNTQPFGSVPAKEIEVETDGLNPQHQGVFQAFAGAILRNEPLIAGGEEGINGLTLSNAMHLSAFLGKPVEIPFDEKLYYDELMKRVATSRRKAPAQAVFANTEGTY